MLKVFYTPKQSVPQNDSYSPSAGKPQRVVEQWLQRYPVELVEPSPVSEQDFCLAHDADYVREVLACRRHNGFGNLSRAVADSLPYTTGSLVSAVRHVLQHGGAACSPTSGFHHACFAHGEGFCTFNGLMVAALLVEVRVGILDCDFHYGNGTDDIIGRRRVERVAHYTTGKVTSTRDPEAFLSELGSILRGMSASLLIYQAGADAHVDDPLGGWMSSEQMRRRDAIVFEFCRRHRVPVVWNLAGGYQEAFQNVLDLHHATMEECLRYFPDGTSPATDSLVELRD